MQAVGQAFVDGVKLPWRVLADRMCVKAPTGKSKEDSMLWFLTGPPDATAQTRMKKNLVVVQESKKSKHGERKCKDLMAHFKEQSEPFLFNFKDLLKALSGKEAVAQSKWMHSWRIVQKGGRLERALITQTTTSEARRKRLA